MNWYSLINSNYCNLKATNMKWKQHFQNIFTNFLFDWHSLPLFLRPSFSFFSLLSLLLTFLSEFALFYLPFLKDLLSFLLASLFSIALEILPFLFYHLYQLFLYISGRFFLISFLSKWNLKCRSDEHYRCRMSHGLKVAQLAGSTVFVYF